MSSAALLDQDFGSESEDDNFNPAPAEDSDNEAAGDSEAELSSKPTKNGAEQRRQSTVKDDEDGENTKGTPPVKGNGLQKNGRRGSGDGEEDEEDGDESGSEDLNGADYDDDEEDEEDEEAVVFLHRWG